MPRDTVILHKFAKTYMFVYTGMAWAKKMGCFRPIFAFFYTGVAKLLIICFVAELWFCLIHIVCTPPPPHLSAGGEGGMGGWW